MKIILKCLRPFLPLISYFLLAVILPTSISFVFAHPPAEIPDEEATSANNHAAGIAKPTNVKGIGDEVQSLVDRAVREVGPALVRIHVVAVEYRGGREIKYESYGSGVIITREGHVVTNHHVAGRSKQVFCTLSNREELEAELIGTDPMTDISILRLKSDWEPKFPTAVFGDSTKLRVGDHVLAMGSPLALSQSVTMGIISNTEMILPRAYGSYKFTLEGEDVGSVVRWIGHDASIYGGNSGGPLINLKGEIIGINEISLGLGGAIPGNLVKSIAEQIIKHKKVARSWIGLEIQPLLKSSKLEKGVLVSGTVAGSPAEKAGFLPGDILVQLAGREVSAKFLEELPLFNQFVLALPVSKEFEATVVRGGKPETLRFKTLERTQALSKSEELSPWGFTGRNLSLFTAKELARQSQDGVLLTSTRAGGPCAEAKPSISEGDIITEVNGVPIKDLKTLADVTEKITKDKSEPVPTLVTFERKKEKLVTVVKVGVRKVEDPGLEVRKAWLPIAHQVLTREMAEALGVPGVKGVRITQVYPRTVAEKAGLLVGDLIVGLNGDPIESSQPEDYEVLPTLVRQYKIGSKLDLKIIRKGNELIISIIAPESPKLAREMKKYLDENFEFTVRDVAFLDRVQEGWKEDQGGALVEEVSEGSWAALGLLSAGDLIVAVDGQPVTDISAFGQLMSKIGKEKRDAVVFHVRRGVHQLYIELKPSWVKRGLQAAAVGKRS